MALGPNGAIAMSTVTLVPTIFQMFLPGLAEVRASVDDDGLNAAGIRSATLTAGLLIAALTAATESKEVALAGSITLAAMVGMYSKARWDLPPSIAAEKA